MININPTDIRDAFFDAIYEIASKDKNVIFISDDMDAFGLHKFKKNLPKQYLNIGVAEQNMIDVAAGLASSGKKPFCFGIASYVTTRCFEQIRFSACSMNLPVVIIGVGTGFSFNFDGPSHQGIHDLGIMRTLPELSILNLSDANLAYASVGLAYKNSGPTYIRLDKGVFPKLYKKVDKFNLGYKILKPLNGTNIVSTGFMTSKAIELLDQNSNLQVGLVDLFQIKPINKKFISEVLAKSKKIISLEENYYTAGIGSLISELIHDNNLDTKLYRMAVRDHQFDVFGSRDWFHELNNLDQKSILKALNG